LCKFKSWLQKILKKFWLQKTLQSTYRLTRP
jgi:hypothetical protein